MRVFGKVLDRKQVKIFVLVGFICLLGVFLRAPSFNEPLDYDEGHYAFFATQVSSGEGFYSTHWIGHPPGIILTYAFIFSLFGKSSESIRIFSAIIGMCSTLMLYKLGKFLFGFKAGLISAFIFALVSSSYVIDGSKSNTEVFMIFFIISAFYLFFAARKQKSNLLLGASGLIAGLAFIVKPSATLDFLCLLLVAFGFGFLPLRRENLKPIVKSSLILVAFLAPLLLTILYFGLTGRFWEFLNWTFLRSLQHIGIPHAQGSTWNFLKASFSSIFKKTYLFWILSWVSVFYILIFDHTFEKCFLIFWSAFSFLGVSLGGWFFPHYFIQVVPPTSLLSGVFISDVFLDWGIQKGQRLHFSRRVLVSLVLLLSLLIFSVLNYSHFPGYVAYLRGELGNREYLARYGFPTWAERLDTGKYLKQMLKKEDTLFVWDTTPIIYFLAGKKPISKYIYSYPLLNEQLMFPTYKGWFSDFGKNRKELMVKLGVNPPDYVVVFVEPEKIFDEMVVFGKFGGFVQEHYSFVENFENVLVFKLINEKEEISTFDEEVSSVPLEIVKRYSAITQVKAGDGQTEITFGPMVNPNGVLRSFKTIYPGIIKIEFEPISAQFLGQDGNDFVGTAVYQPSGVADLHIRVKGQPKPISFVRVKMGDDAWNNQHYGVNPALKVIQKGEIFDLYFEPRSDWKGKAFNIYFIYEDGSLAQAEVVGGKGK